MGPGGRAGRRTQSSRLIPDRIRSPTEDRRQHGTGVGGGGEGERAKRRWRKAIRENRTEVPQNIPQKTPGRPGSSTTGPRMDEWTVPRGLERPIPRGDDVN